MATSELGKVESQRLEGISRIEANERRISDLRTQVEVAKTNAHEEIHGMISAFHNFESKYWKKEEVWQQQLNMIQ
jgi:hypothetical protein